MPFPGIICIKHTTQTFPALSVEKQFNKQETKNHLLNYQCFTVLKRTTRDTALGSHRELSAHTTYSGVTQISVPATQEIFIMKKNELQTGFSALKSKERETPTPGCTNSPSLCIIPILVPASTRQPASSKDHTSRFCNGTLHQLRLFPLSDTYPKSLCY